MTPLGWLQLGVVGLVGAIWLEYRWRRTKHRPLVKAHPSYSDGTPQKVALGHEAIDKAAFERHVAENAALANKTGADAKLHSWTAVHSQPPKRLDNHES